MEKTIAIFTIFTFMLFVVTTARIALGPDTVVTDHATKSKSSTESDSDVVQLTEIDESTVADRLPESENTQNLDVRTVESIHQTPRLIFSRSHPIMRHFSDETTRIPLRFVRRHPCRKFQKALMIPRSKVSYGNDVILTEKTVSFDPKALGDQVPSKWLEIKRNYGHHHHHGHIDKEGEFEIRYEHDMKRINNLFLHRKEMKKKKREHKGGFMRRIRKFLKHTFD